MNARAAEKAPPLSSGALVAPGYEVIEHLRRGNDFDVYDAWSHGRRSRCVVKAMRPERAGRHRHSLEREAQLLLRLSHPHIVRAYELLAGPVPALVLETLPGATLSALIDEEPPPDPVGVGHLGLQLGSALAYLHGAGYLHLDLKPSNVIADAGRAKLIDLSLARPPGPAPEGLGTWLYLAPEQARGDALGPAADVWGLGATLFELVTGEGPYDDHPDACPDLDEESESSAPPPQRYPQLERPPRRPESVRPVAAPVAELIVACLDPEPRARPAVDRLLARFESLAELPAAERRWSAPAQPESR